MKITKKTLIYIIKEEIKNLEKSPQVDFPMSNNEISVCADQKLMNVLYKFRNKNIGNKLDLIISKFKITTQWGKYSTPNHWFENVKYKTFMDFFKRKLSDYKLNKILSQKENILSFPCECIIESLGEFNTDTNFNGYKLFTSILGEKEKSKVLELKLKKHVSDITHDLKKVGIPNIENLSFINMKLLKSFYHRIHSPINGIIKSIIEISPENELFGDNVLWVVEILTADYGEIYLLLVGELSIQDFEFNIKVGDKINMFDEIGSFNWGSQIVLIYDSNKFKFKSFISQSKQYFIGDTIFER